MSDLRASVTVVIPMFNSEATIKRALDSIADQTLLPRQVIVIDDASTDSSREVVQAWTHPEVTIELLRNQKNLGPSASRNLGWDNSSEPLIAFLDSDDAWHPLKLEIQANYMDSNRLLVMIGHQYEIFDRDSKQIFLPSNLRLSTFQLRDFLIKNRLSTPTVMIRREIQHRFCTEQRFAEDYRLWMEIVAHHGEVAFIHAPLARLFKPAYGSSGLSSNMRRMLEGELAAVRALRHQKLITQPTYFITSAWLAIKYCRRVMFSRLGSK